MLSNNVVLSLPFLSRGNFGFTFCVLDPEPQIVV